MRDPLLGLGTEPCALRPRLSGSKASEEHQLKNRWSKQTVRAQQKGQHATHSPRKVKPIVSSHKKGTAPDKQMYISQEKDRSKPNRLLCHLTRKGPLLQNKQRPQSKLSQQITKCVWISGTLSQHVAWLCDSRFLSQGILYHRKRGQAVLQKDIQTFSYCPGDSTRSVQWVMIQDKPGRVLRSFVLDHSWTPFNKRPSDSRNCCRARVEPPNPRQEIIFSSTFFSMETN